MSTIMIEAFEKTAKKLSSKERKGLPSSDFVFPKERKYPIEDRSHAANAEARASGKPEESKVDAAVHQKYPGIGKEAVLKGFAKRAEDSEPSRHDLVNALEEHEKFERPGDEKRESKKTQETEDKAGTEAHGKD